MKHRYETVNGLKMHYIESGNSENPTLFLLHGWPDLWISWKKIMLSFNSFYHVIAMEMTGYGESSLKRDVKYYTMKFQCDLIVALMEIMKKKKCIFVGHDWGGYLAWRMGIYYPEKCDGIAAFCTSYTPPSIIYYSLKDVSKVAPSLKYQYYFEQNTEEVSNYFSHNVQTVINNIFRTFDETSLTIEENGKMVFNENLQKTKLLTGDEFDFYIDIFSKSTFRYCFNWYLTRKLNWEDELPFVDKKELNMPCLMVTAGKDIALKAEMTKGMEKFIPNLSRGHVENSSHWILYEAPNECINILSNWLNSFNKSKL
eukprot:gene7631-11953_t